MPETLDLGNGKVFEFSDERVYLMEIMTILQAAKHIRKALKGIDKLNKAERQILEGSIFDDPTLSHQVERIFVSAHRALRARGVVE